MGYGRRMGAGWGLRYQNSIWQEISNIDFHELEEQDKTCNSVQLGFWFLNNRMIAINLSLFKPEDSVGVINGSEIEQYIPSTGWWFAGVLITQLSFKPK